MGENDILKIHSAAASLAKLTETSEPGLFTYTTTVIREVDFLLDVLAVMQHPRVLARRP